MRLESAASAKGTKGCGATQKEPRPGSHLRILWDAFHLYKGEPIDITWVGSSGRVRTNALRQLIDFYGLDIRRTNIRIEEKRRGKPNYKYTLVGEWFGLEYRDYLAAKIKAADKKHNTKS